MCENALQLRRRCLFLLDGGAMTPLLQQPNATKRVEAILQSCRALEPALDAITTRWLQSHALADWQECVECLLFGVEQAEAGRACRRALLELADLFVDAAREYNDAADKFAESYWKRVLRNSEEEGVDALSHADGPRVTWSIAADLPPAVAQLFWQ